MPQEFRRITFSNEELHAALLAHVDAKAVIMAMGKIQAVSIERDRPRAVTVYCGVGKSDKKVVDIPADVVVSALVAYCKDQRIPLPRHARTSIAADGNRLSLIKRLDTGAGESQIHLI